MAPNPSSKYDSKFSDIAIWWTLHPFRDTGTSWTVDYEACYIFLNTLSCREGHY